MSEAAAERMDALIEDVEESLATLEEHANGGGSIEKAITELHNLVEVIDEIEDITEAIDLSDLPEAVDGSGLVDAIEAGEIPDAIRERDPKAAVDLKKLLKAIELRELWSSTDVRELWQQKRELDEEVDELTDDSVDEDEEGEDDGSLVDEAESLLGGSDENDDEDEESGFFGDDENETKSLIEELEAAVGDEGEEDDDGSLIGGDDEDDSGFFGGDEEEDDGGFFGSDEDDSTRSGDVAEETELGDIPSESYQTMIQKKAMDAIDEFREGVLDAHAKLKDVHYENRERMSTQREDKQSSSRNPTAYSSIPIERADVGSGTRHSTVRQNTLYSTAPNRKRIYGNRFDQETDDE